MRTAIAFFLMLVIGTGLGIASAYVAVREGIGVDSVRTTSWKGWPNAGLADSDPYTRANVTRLNEFPLSGGDGLTLLAETDDGGETLDGRCHYRISGQTPPAQWWTLTIYDAEERRPIANPANRFGFTSAEIIRDHDGGFDIEIAPEIKPGNWLPTGSGDAFVLVLRLYNEPAALGGRVDAAGLPRIIRGGCA